MPSKVSLESTKSYGKIMSNLHALRTKAKAGGSKSRSPSRFDNDSIFMSNANLLPGYPNTDKKMHIKDYNIQMPFSQPGGGIPAVIKKNPLALNIGPPNFLEET